MTAPPAATGTPEVLAAPRTPVLLQGAAGAVVGGVLAGLALLGPGPLTAGAAAVQLLLVLGFLALADAPAATGAFLISVAAAVACDVLALADDGRIGGLAGVVALALVAALLLQLSRRVRTRVTEALADTLVVVVLVACAACLPAAAQLARLTDQTVTAGLLSGAITLLAGRAVDSVLPRPLLVVGATRGWPGLVVGALLGSTAAVAVGPGGTTGPGAALLGLACAAVVAAADLAVDLMAADLRPGPADERQVSALRPVLALLPFAVVAPVVLLATRLLERMA